MVERPIIIITVIIIIIIIMRSHTLCWTNHYSQLCSAGCICKQSKCTVLHECHLAIYLSMWGTYIIWTYRNPSADKAVKMDGWIIWTACRQHIAVNSASGCYIWVGSPLQHPPEECWLLHMRDVTSQQGLKFLPLTDFFMVLAHLFPW